LDISKDTVVAKTAGEVAVMIESSGKAPTKKAASGYTMRFLLLNKPEWWLYFLGGLGAAINGAVMPCFSILFSSLLTSLGTDKANFWALLFVFLSVGAFMSNFAQIGLFKYAGEKLTRRLRELSFRALMRQEIGYFDKEENTTGAICAKLAEDARYIILN
jgi:ABC-type multidrug transport system fused ATPase/permease subunit